MMRKCLNEICRIFGETPEFWVGEQFIDNKETYNRVFDLLMAARAWEYYNFVSPRGRMHYQVYNGRVKLIDLLSIEQINLEDVMFAGSKMSMASR